LQLCSAGLLDYEAIDEDILSQALKVPLWYISTPPPNRAVLLLSRMSQLLSVCNPSDLHRGVRPHIDLKRTNYICT